MPTKLTTHATEQDQKPARRTGQTRRQFLCRTGAFVGGSAFASAALPGCSHSAPRTVGEYALAKPENLIYTTCLQCHVDCQVKAKTWDGVLAKLTGSPYSPQNYLPHLPYETPPQAAATADGKLCAKGQAGIQTYADPYRLRKVLKRVGPRGSNEWKSIPFDQFIEEVVEGGKLFSEIGDDAHYPGFKEVYVLRDRAVAKALARDAKKVAEGTMSVAAFKAAHRAHLDKLLDPEHPDLGPKNNQFVFQAGRIEHGRKELMEWFTNKSFGSVNAFEHTTICEQSHHIAYSMMTGHKTHHLKPDLANTEFVVFWGTGAYTANFGLTPMAEKVTSGRSERGLKVAVVDPRLSNDAGKADWWLPVRPGTDGALALGMARWILENERYDARYLANANRAAASADGEPTWTNASYLVKVEHGVAHKLLRADEVSTPTGPLGTAEQYVVWSHGSPVAVTPDDKSAPVEGELFVSRSIDGIEVKSSLQLLREEAMSRTLQDVERITAVPQRQIVEVARELTSHGKRAAVELYRGPVQHTDGYYAGCAVITLNLLIGNADWKGGLAKGGGHWHESGGKAGSRYHMGALHPSTFPAFGPRITREKARYEDSSLYREAGYPAKRPWYPFSGNVYQEIIPSFAQGYPYAGKILLLHKGTPALATPAGHTVIDMLRDQKKVPLFIASDIVVGETSMYADYIVPDLTYLERWGTPHVTPDVTTMTSKIRQPVAVPLTEEVKVGDEIMPICLEAFMLAVAARLGLPGFGKKGYSDGAALTRPEDWYLRLVANIAAGDKAGEAVPDAPENELELFRKARAHLPKSVFDEARWKRAVGGRDWSKVVYVLNRGGRFAPHEVAYDGEYMHKKLGAMFHIFVEHVAEQKNSMSGKPFVGYPAFRGQFDCAGKPMRESSEYPFALITYKEPFGGHSRTIGNYWANVALQNTNYVVMNKEDAESIGVRDGDHVRLISATNGAGRIDLGNGQTVELVAPARVVQGMRPGVVGVSWHFGHWAYGARDVYVDNERIPGDSRRQAGICPNAAMLVDPVLKDVCLTDPIGASASFYDSPVAVKKA